MNRRRDEAGLGGFFLRMVPLYMFREAGKNMFAAESSSGVAEKDSRRVWVVILLREKERDNLQSYFNQEAEFIMDWFHVAMRLTVVGHRLRVY